MITFGAAYASALESVAKARRDVAAFAQSCGVDGGDIADIVLALGEACSNAVEHGHVHGGSLHVRCSLAGGIFAVRVSDGGRGFDEDPSMHRAPGELGRGRGIPIMRALMDAVRYIREPDGMTVVLEKRISVRSGSETAGEARGIDAGGCRKA